MSEMKDGAAPRTLVTRRGGAGTLHPFDMVRASSLVLPDGGKEVMREHTRDSFRGENKKMNRQPEPGRPFLSVVEWELFGVDMGLFTGCFGLFWG